MKKFLHFGLLQIQCCIFPIVIFLSLAITKHIPVPLLPRYDLILLICILTQVFMVIGKLETIKELWIICLFHVIGLCMEIFKIQMGSWSYPEFSYIRIADVPLYSGFMYASVASYVCQAYRRLRLKFIKWPDMRITFLLACVIYANFFTHHFIFDFRWIIIATIVIVFFKSQVQFRIDESKYKMPLNIAFLLIGVFIWFAENISTFFSAWAYPDQLDIWQVVHIGKITSWFLFSIIAIILVVNLKAIQEKKHKKTN